jgi:glycosyltransferase involved in cell wall biosynthesis
MPVSVDIVLPCYNPAANWHYDVIDFFNKANALYSINFIVVNDGSTQENVAHQIQYLQQQNISLQYLSYKKNKGKGHALREGVLVSNAHFIVYTDVDFPFTDNSTMAVINALVKGEADVIVGYRNENYYQKSMSTYRRLLSKTFRFFIRNVLRMAVTDTQCGLKGFNKKGRTKFLETKINRYLFDFEFIYACGKDKNLTINTVQVELKENIIFSKIKLKSFIQEFVNLLMILLFRKS